MQTPRSPEGSFLIEGRIFGWVLRLGHDGERPVGNPGLVAALEELAEVREGEALGDFGITFTATSHLDDVRSALLIAKALPWDEWWYVAGPEGAAVLPGIYEGAGVAG